MLLARTYALDYGVDDCRLHLPTKPRLCCWLLSADLIESVDSLAISLLLLLLLLLRDGSGAVHALQ